MSFLPDELKDLGAIVAAALTAPVALVWKRSIGAVQKEEFRAGISAIADELKEHNKTDRETFLALFKKLEDQNDKLSDLKEAAARVETTLTFIRPQK